MVIINYLKYLTPQTDFDIKIEFDDINLNIISNITTNETDIGNLQDNFYEDSPPK